MDSNTRDVYVLGEHDDRLVIGFGFSFFNADSPATITHNDKTYVRGLLEAIPSAYASSLCSSRNYVLQVPLEKSNTIPQYTNIPKREQENVLSALWELILLSEHQASVTPSALDRLHTEQYFKLWNRVTGDTKKARWENK
jgi:hypothetical protein